MKDDQDVDLAHLDIPTLEALVGRKAVDVQVRGKWVVCLFKGFLAEGVCSAPISVSFKKW